MIEIKINLKITAEIILHFQDIYFNILYNIHRVIMYVMFHNFYCLEHLVTFIKFGIFVSNIIALKGTNFVNNQS